MKHLKNYLKSVKCLNNMADTEESLRKSLIKFEKLNNEIVIQEKLAAQATEAIKEVKMLKKLYKEAEKFEKELKESFLRYSKKEGVKTLENDHIKMTACEKHTYKVGDPSLLPKKYEILAKEEEIKRKYKEVKNDFEVLHKEIPGIIQNITEYTRVTFKKELGE